jgi:hypothetical protein
MNAMQGLANRDVLNAMTHCARQTGVNDAATDDNTRLMMNQNSRSVKNSEKHVKS